jgi:hypothetical protein
VRAFPEHRDVLIELKSNLLSLYARDFQCRFTKNPEESGCRDNIRTGMRSSMVQTCRYSWPCFLVYSKHLQGQGTMAHCENCIEQINHREFPPAACLKQVGKPQVTMSDTAFSLLDSLLHPACLNS